MSMPENEKQLDHETTEKLISPRSAMIQKLRILSLEHGKLLFDGNWLSPEDARRCYRRLQWKHFRWFLETLLLYFLLLCLTGIVFFILKMLVG